MAASIGVTDAYVAVLYLPFNVGDRDDRRIIAPVKITLSDLDLFTRHRVPDAPHKLSQCTILSRRDLLHVSNPHALRAARHLHPHHWHRDLQSHIIAAPMLEAMVFRRHMLLLWSW